MSLLKRLTWVPVLTWQRVRPANAGDPQQPSFLTMAALLSFPGAALALEIIWIGADQLFDYSSRNVPIVAGYAIGLVIWLWGVTDTPRPGVRSAAFGLFIAALNSTYLILSVMGIDVGLDAAVDVDPVPDHMPVGD